jgi:hypothetical protein
MDLDDAKAIISAVEDALRAGGKPPDAPTSSHERKAVAMAADALGKHRTTIARDLTQIRAKFGLEPDWALYAEPKVEEEPIQVEPDHKEIVRLRDENAKLRRQLLEGHRSELDNEAIREILGGFSAHEADPPKWTVDVQSSGGATMQVPMTIWSDWHVGEVVSLEETSGVNEYNKAIFQDRVRRLVSRTIDLLKNHGPGNYPGIIVNLIGDLVSGGLHPELAKTDEEESIPSVLTTVDVLIWAFEQLISEFGQVFVPCASGNHGRSTPKPEYKRYVFKNFDWLICQLVARHFMHRPEIVFSIPSSNEVNYRVFGKRYLAMHGDMMGVRGGDGIIGSIGPISRGAMKVGKQHAVIGSDFDTLVIGHFHQALWLPGVIVNNTLKGFDEYCKNSLRAPPSTPSQSLWLEHPKWGRTAMREVFVEDPATEAGADWVSVFRKVA